MIGRQPGPIKRAIYVDVEYFENLPEDFDVKAHFHTNGKSLLHCLCSSYGVIKNEEERLRCLKAVLAHSSCTKEFVCDTKYKQLTCQDMAYNSEFQLLYNELRLYIKGEEQGFNKDKLRDGLGEYGAPNAIQLSIINADIVRLKQLIAINCKAAVNALLGIHDRNLEGFRKLNGLCSNYRMTNLHLAVLFGGREAVELLLESVNYITEINATTSIGILGVYEEDKSYTALDFAYFIRDKIIAKILKIHGAEAYEFESPWSRRRDSAAASIERSSTSTEKMFGSSPKNNSLKSFEV